MDSWGSAGIVSMSYSICSICTFSLHLMILPHYLLDCFVLQVDDGFWEGELNGRIGVFPSLVVELVHDEGEEEEEQVRLYSLYGFPDPVNHDISRWWCYKYNITRKALNHLHSDILLFTCFLTDCSSSDIYFSPASPHPNHTSLLFPHPNSFEPWLLFST